VVVPVYNEDEAVIAFHAQLREAIDPLFYSFTITYVNDGSTDGTAQALQEIASQDERVVVVELSRNFGHQAALTAGLDLAEGEYVITMDGDGSTRPPCWAKCCAWQKAAMMWCWPSGSEAEQADNRLSFKRWSLDLVLPPDQPDWRHLHPARRRTSACSAGRWCWRCARCANTIACCAAW
jgi:dolichol-phosphate mannosyltransferase